MTAEEVLKQVFGYDRFREGQRYLIDALAGGRDALGILPTGGGKSLCYQVPALMRDDGITVVISPLISLMKDQVMALKARGVAAAYLNSTLTPSQLALANERAMRGQYRIIYVAPERLKTPSFRQLAEAQRIRLLAVDEAHCVSQWGQDFRPDYLGIGEFLESLPERPVLGAFTATATEAVRRDIIRLLKMRSPTSITTGFDRPNLYFGVRKVEQAEKENALEELLGRYREQSVIVYCSSRKTVDRLAELLKTRGWAAAAYHAGLPEDIRREAQEAFTADRVRVMVATCAFGMGIDKPDVRCVIHYNMPRSPEAYYQEAGRAGRDGKPGECVLLCAPNDVAAARYVLMNSEPNPALTPQQQAFIRKQDLVRLESMERYTETGACLRQHLIRYFGQKAPAECGNCSSCLRKQKTRPALPFRPKGRPRMDLSGIVPGATVWHQRFGEGRIESIDPDKHRMTVIFAHDTKQFAYPDALYSAYLTAEKPGKL